MMISRRRRLGVGRPSAALGAPSAALVAASAAVVAVVALGGSAAWSATTSGGSTGTGTSGGTPSTAPSSTGPTGTGPTGTGPTGTGPTGTGPTGTSPTHTGTSTSSSSSSCGGPRTTSVTPGQVVRTFDFEDGEVGPWAPRNGATLATTEEAAHTGQRSLRIDGLAGGGAVRFGSGISAHGTFVATAWVRLGPDQPASRVVLQPVSATVSLPDAEAPGETWAELNATAAPQIYTADWTCSGGGMTGGLIPGAATFELNVQRLCLGGGTERADTVYVDDVVITAKAGGSTSGSVSATPPCESSTTSTTSTTESPDTSTSPDLPTCRVSYRVASAWPGGFLAEVTVRNLSTEPLPRWRLAWRFAGDERIDQHWLADIEQAGATVAAEPAYDWSALSPGGSHYFGFVGSGSAKPQVPTQFTLDGHPCVLG